MDLAAERAYQTPLVNSTLLPMLLLSLARQKHAPETSKTIKTEYDFVIVGGGSAGSVVASRLSEMPCVNVLLLEAGKSPPLLTEVPGLARFFWFTDIDWQYRTAPQRYTGKALINRQLIWPSGKALGGSSILNGNLVVRGNRKNYDQWAEEGAEGWSYKDVLPYFKKMEDNRDPEYVANGFHGVGGPETEHRPRYQAEFKDPIFKTIQSLGYKVVDPNGHRQTGFYDLQGTLRAGQRCSTAKAYLVPAENRTNLDILPNAMVRKVVMKDQQAVGVEFDFQGTTYVVKAKREVIMSAGTTNTAQLLMLSGIGPRKELERFKIPIVADLPVGMNLQDHVGTFHGFLFNPEIPRVTEKISNPANIAQYIQNRTGPLSSTEFISVLAFLKNQALVPKKDFPDHQLYFNEVQSEVISQVGLRPEVYAKVYAPYEGRSFYLCVSSVLHPRSRGTVTLQSTDPYDPPIIDPNYFDDPKDIQDIVEGLKTCMRIGTHPIMRNVGSAPFQMDFPGCEQYAGKEDLYFWCVAENMVITFNHQVGTARMGDPSDPRTVVDPQLRVLKVKGLRVVDASVMPLVPSGNTNVPTIMVAEKASDIIKSTLECYEKPNKWNERESTLPYESSLSKRYDQASLPDTLGHNNEEDRWEEPDYPMWEDPHRYPIDSVRETHEQNEEQENDYSSDAVSKPWAKNLPKLVPWNEENSNLAPWSKENPVDAIWNNREPVDTPWKKGNPVHEPWKEKNPIEEPWKKENPIEEPWKKENPIEEPWKKEHPIEEPWNKDQPVEEPWNKENPVEEPWDKGIPVEVPMNKQIPDGVSLNNESPVNIPWNKETPVDTPWKKENPIDVSLNKGNPDAVWHKETPADVPSKKEIPVHLPWNVDKPANVAWNKERPVDVPLNKENPTDVTWNKDVPEDVVVPWNKAIPVDIPWSNENPNHEPLSEESPTNEPLSKENPNDLDGNKNNSNESPWVKENPNHEQLNKGKPNYEPLSDEKLDYESLSEDKPNHEPLNEEKPNEPQDEENLKLEPHKETPKVVPWNLELIQINKPPVKKHLIDLTENQNSPESGNREISKQELSNSFPENQHPENQAQIQNPKNSQQFSNFVPSRPQNNIPSQVRNKYLQKNIQVQITKTPSSQLPMRINELKSKIQQIIDQLMNPGPPNAPSNPMRPNKPLNPVSLNSPEISPNQVLPVNTALLKEMKLLKEASSCDEDFCNSLIKFKQCRQNSCKKKSEFVAYVHSILCPS